MQSNLPQTPFSAGRAALFAGAAAVIACALAGPASANLITTGSSGFSIMDTVPTSITGGPAPLTATLAFGNFVFGAGGTTFSTDISVTNLTSAALFPSARLTDFGFNTQPNATGINDTSAIFTTFLDKTIPSFGKVDVCASTGPTCAGGGGGDLAPGASNAFTLTLTGLPTNTTQIELGADTFGSATETYFFKWQTAIGSFESSCVYGSSCGSQKVPEPMSVTLLGAGLLGLGLVRLRAKLGANRG